MRKLIYDVAVTLDGFIAHADGSIGGFVPDGEHVADYQDRLAGYGTVVMGRKTYEFGYAYGLEPGRRAYPHMDHHIVSSTLDFSGFEQVEVEVVSPADLSFVGDLKAADGDDIYLCGGGLLAGALFDAGWIDRLILKVNPSTIGDGIPLFGASRRQVAWTQIGAKTYDSGVVLLTYDLAGDLGS